MVIIDEPLLASMRLAGPCDLCSKWCRSREPAHILSRGMGGGRRIDHRLNLLALGTVFQCDCHNRIHRGKIGEAEQWAAVAEREVTTPEAAQFEIRRIRALHPSEIET